MSSAESKPAGQAISALRNLAIAVVVLGGLFAAYYMYVQNSKAIKELNKKAYDLVQKDNPAEYVKAAAALDGALAIRSKDQYAVGARAMVASILWAEYGLESEKEVAATMVTRADKLGLNTKERFLADGLFLVASGQPADAEKTLVVLAEKGITPAEVIEPLGLARARQGRMDAARSDFKQASEREWRTARYLALYADAFYDAGDFSSAASTYRKALDVNPTHLRSLIGKARADVARNEYVDESLQALADQLAKAGDDALPPTMKARALAGLAEGLYASGKFPEAATAATAAVAAEIKGDPGSAYAHYDLGLALARQKKGLASDEIKKAIELSPPVARFYFQGALALAEAGKAAAGQELFDAYGKSFKQNDAFQIARGDFLRATGNLEEALKAYDAAIAENNVNPDAYYKKGYVLQLQGSAPKADKKKLYNAARETYEKAVGIRDRFPDVYRQMGLIYLDDNPRSTDATDAFGKALVYYKEQKAPKSVFEAFIGEVEAKYKKANLKGNAEAWVKEATPYMN